MHLPRAFTFELEHMGGVLEHRGAVRNADQRRATGAQVFDNAASLVLSRALVASSSITMLGALASARAGARANARRC